MAKKISPSQNRPNDQQVKEAIKTLIRYAGDDPEREGLKDTPKRVMKAYDEFYRGYTLNPQDILKTTFKKNPHYDQPILLQNIPFISHCEHHMVPIIGSASISYIPENQIVGISKLARIVDMFSRRLQIQEQMTIDIAQTIDQHLKPKGTAVFIKAQHHCMKTRGVNKENIDMITYHFLGEFAQNKTQQKRFLNQVQSI